MKHKEMLFKINYNGETHVMRFENGQNFEDLRSCVQNSFKVIPKKFVFVYIDEDEDEVSLDNDFDLDSLMTRDVSKVFIKIVKIDEHESEEKMVFGKNGEKLIKEENGLKMRKSSSVDSSSFNEYEEEESIPFINIDDMKEECFKKEEKYEKEKKEEKNGEKKAVDVNQGKKQPIHENIQCDLCGIQPLAGIRYKCSICSNFDLCEDCETVFDHQHALLKIKHINQEFSHRNESIQYVLTKMALIGAEKVKNGCQTVSKFIKDVFSNNNDEEKAKSKKDLDNEVEKAVSEFRSSAVSSKIKDPKGEDRMVEYASYLSSILNIDFNQGYSFVKENPHLNKQSLVVEFFKREKNLRKYD